MIWAGKWHQRCGELGYSQVGNCEYLCGRHRDAWPRPQSEESLLYSSGQLGQDLRQLQGATSAQGYTLAFAMTEQNGGIKFGAFQPNTGPLLSSPGERALAETLSSLHCSPAFPSAQSSFLPLPFFSLINSLHPKLHLRVSFRESGLCQSLKATVKGSLQAPPHNLPHFLCSSFYLSILSLCLYFVLSIFRAFRFNGLLYTACPRAVRSWQKPIQTSCQVEQERKKILNQCVFPCNHTWANLSAAVFYPASLA